MLAYCTAKCAVRQASKCNDIQSFTPVKQQCFKSPEADEALAPSGLAVGPLDPQLTANKRSSVQRCWRVFLQRLQPFQHCMKWRFKMPRSHGLLQELVEIPQPISQAQVGPPPERNTAYIQTASPTHFAGLKAPNRPVGNLVFPEGPTGCFFPRWHSYAISTPEGLMSDSCRRQHRSVADLVATL